MRSALVPLVLLLSACRGLPADEAALEGFWQRSDDGDVLTVLAIGDGFSTLADDGGVVTRFDAGGRVVPSGYVLLRMEP